jgi:uncharacterized protein
MKTSGQLFSKFKDNFLEFILKYQKASVVLGVILSITLSLGVSKLSSDFSFKVWYSKDHPLLKSFTQFEKEFGNDDQIVMALEFPDSVLKKENIQVVHKLSDALWEVRNIVRVDSLSNYNVIKSDEENIEILPFYEEDMEYSVQSSKEILKSDKVAYNYLISEDKKVALLYAKLRPFFEETPNYRETVLEAQAKVKEIVPSHVNTYVTGAAKLADDFRVSSENDFIYVTAVIHIIFIVLLYFIFKSLTAIIFSLLIIWMSVAASLGLNGILGYNINVISSIMPIILITVGLADAVHILTSLIFKLKEESSYKESLEYALEKNFYPTLFTSLSTSIGFLSFYSASLEPIKFMGVITGVGVVLIWVLTYLFAPILIWAERFKITRFKLPVKKERTFSKSLKIVDLVNGHYKWINLIAIIILGLSFYQAYNLGPNINPYEQFKPDHPMRKSINFLSEKIKAVTPVEIVLDAKIENGIQNPAFLKKVESFKVWLEDLSYVHKTTSLLDIYKKTNLSLEGKFELPTTSQKAAEQLLMYTLSVPEGKSLTSQMNLKRSKMRLTAYWSLKESVESLEAINLIEAKAKEFDLEVIVTGKLPLFLRMNPYIVETFLNSFITALILITLFLIVCLGSIKLGLLALIPNIFPILVGGAIFDLMGMDLDLGTVLVASVCLGIAVDDSIHLLFDFQKNKRNQFDFSQNLTLITKKTYPALFFTTLLLMVGFSSLLTADFIPNIRFGISVASILGVALITDFIVLPSLLRQFAK